MEAMQSGGGERKFDAERIAALLNQPPSTPAVPEQPSNFTSFKLPRGVEVQLPKGWWLLGSEQLRLIQTTAEAAMDLSGLKLPDGQRVTLIAANSLPKSTYAAILINSITPPTMTHAGMAAITPAEVAKLGQKAQQYLQKGMQVQGLQLLEFMGFRVEKFAGFPTLIAEYRRTGSSGPVWVQQIQVFTEQQEIGINLSYRESETMLWKPVVAKIRQSIVVKPW